MEILVISGLSGAGKSCAASCLEDIGYYTVDNMPAAIIPKFAEFSAESDGRYDRIALVNDIRGGVDSFHELLEVIDRLREGRCTIELGFILSDLTTSYKRIADHCSNIAVCLIQADNDEYERHSYLNSLKEEDNQQFREQFEEYGKEYALPARIKGTPKVDMRARMTAG